MDEKLAFFSAMRGTCWSFRFRPSLVVNVSVTIATRLVTYASSFILSNSATDFWCSLSYNLYSSSVNGASCVTTKQNDLVVLRAVEMRS